MSSESPEDGRLSDGALDMQFSMCLHGRGSEVAYAVKLLRADHDLLRADLAASREAEQEAKRQATVCGESYEYWNRRAVEEIARAEAAERREQEAVAQVAALADLIPKALEGAHWNESCGPDYDDGCSCMLGTLAKTLANLPTAARDLLAERDALREALRFIADMDCLPELEKYAVTRVKAASKFARAALQPTPPQADTAPREGRK